MQLRILSLSMGCVLLVACPEIIVPNNVGSTVDVDVSTDLAGGDVSGVDNGAPDVEVDAGQACTADSECDDGDPCTEDKCSTTNQCAHFAAEDVCSIDGACHTAGTIPSINACKVCDPTQNAADWSDVDCDDGNACTANECDANNGCENPVDDAAACDDGQACSSDDRCFAGACVGTCTCTADIDCANSQVGACERPACVASVCEGVPDDSTNGNTCDDGDACTQSDACVAGACAGGPAVDCDDGEVCTADSCNVVAGCQNVPTEGLCNDGDECTGNDACAGGVCLGQATGGVCDDGNPCTDDTCDSVAGCTYTSNTAACDDGNACTNAGICSAGSCETGPFIDCDDNNDCTLNGCNPSTGCDNAADPAATSCDDGDECTDNDTCVNGSCDGLGGLDCDDSDPCTIDSCTLESGCVNTPHTDACDDGDVCTTGETCATGTCEGGEAMVCDDSNPCTSDSCDPSAGCVYTDNTMACDDGDACTQGDACSGGTCGAGSPIDCDDGEVCTDDSCDALTGCVHFDNAASCDDGDACTTADACFGGGCVGGAALNCDDSNNCTDDTCNTASGCINSPNTAPCDDGNGCTTTDQCSGGSCVGSGGQNCDDGNPCTTDSCTPGTGCTYANNTASCEDGNACTTGDQCAAGSCVGGGPLTCNDGNVCTNDSCIPGSGCQFTNNTASCSDGNACTTSDACSGGSCAGGPAPNCNDGNVCTNDSCNPGSGCVNSNNTVGCNDSNACTNNDKCSGGSCSGSAISCNDGNVCTSDTCSTASGCVNSNNSIPCNDSDSCTTGDSCSGGSCSGTPLNCDDAELCTDDYCTNGTCFHDDLANLAPCGTGGQCIFGECACFTGETMVMTATGARPISEVRAGDQVLSTDQDTKRTALQVVREVEKKWASELTTLTLDDGSSFTATPNHYLWVQGTAWVKAGDVRSGDAFRNETGESVVVTTVRTFVPETSVPVFNLIVEDTKTYHVGSAGVLAHTCDFTLNVADEALRSRVMNDVPNGANVAGPGTDEAMVLFNAQTGQLVMADTGSGAQKALPCVPLAKWSRKVGVKDDHLLVLDTERRTLVLVPLQELRDVHRGELGCVDGGNRGITVPLPTNQRPFDALLAGDRVFVSYFDSGANHVEMFEWTVENSGPGLRHARSWQLASTGTPLGLSGMAFDGTTLYVAGAAYTCGGPGCTERFAPPHLFAVEVDASGAVFADLQPANMNAVGVFRHPVSGHTFALLGGDHVDGYSSIQPITAGVLGEELGVGGDAALGEKAFPIGDEHALLLQMSGDHVFLLHVPTGVIQARWEFDGTRFAALGSKAWDLDTRRQADFQDVIADGNGGYVLVDSKSEQLVRVMIDVTAAQPTISVVERVPLQQGNTSAGTPAWGVWLDR